MRYDPKHKIRIEENKTNLSSLFLAAVGICYILVPFDLFPDTLTLIGWVEDILIGIVSLVLIKEGLDGKSPIEAIRKLV